MVPNDGVLQFSDDQTITVSYSNASDINGQSQILTDTAVTDCRGPVLSGLDIQAPGSVVTIRFTTDEPARVTLSYGLSCDDLSSTEIHTEDLLGEHVIKIRNLLPDSTYHFVIE